MKKQAMGIKLALVILVNSSCILGGIGGSYFVPEALAAQVNLRCEKPRPSRSYSYGFNSLVSVITGNNADGTPITKNYKFSEVPTMGSDSNGPYLEGPAIHPDTGETYLIRIICDKINPRTLVTSAP